MKLAKVKIGKKSLIRLTLIFLFIVLTIFFVFYFISIKAESDISVVVSNPIIKGNLWSKKVVISSAYSNHVYNISVSTDIPENLVDVQLYHYITSDMRMEVTDNPYYSFQLTDTDNNGKIDTVSWIVPELSEVTFTVEGTISSDGRLETITITGYSGDMTCGLIDAACLSEGRDMCECGYCCAYINLTLNSKVCIPPNDDWVFKTDFPIFMWVLHARDITDGRDVGNGWHLIQRIHPYNESVPYAYCFEPKDWEIRIVAMKANPAETIKWSFANIDPYWFGWFGPLSGSCTGGSVPDCSYPSCPDSCGCMLGDYLCSALCSSLDEGMCEICGCTWEAGTTTTSSTSTSTTSTVPPKYWDNSTNSTLVSSAIEHRLRWTDDDSGLSGFIFSFFNGTNTTSVASYNWTSADKESGVNVSKAQIYVPALIKLYNFSDTTNNKAYNASPAGSTPWGGTEAAYFCTGSGSCDPVDSQSCCSYAGCSWIIDFCTGSFPGCSNATSSYCCSQYGCTWFSLYTKLSTDDNNYANSTSDNNQDEPYWRFNYTITDNAANINWVYVAHSGFENSDSETGTCYVYNTSGTWLTLGTLNKGSETTISQNYTGNFSTIIGSNNQLVLYCEGANFDTGESIVTDFPEVRVGSSQTNYESEVNKTWYNYSGFAGNDYQKVDKIKTILTIDAYDPRASNHSITGSCSGMVICIELDETYCEDCGCTWTGTCTGGTHPCTGISQSTCSNCGCTWTSTTFYEPDLEIGIYNGTSYINGTYCSINNTMGSDAVNTTDWNCTITKTNSQFLNSWNISGNRKIIFRGIFMDSNATYIDEINVSNVFVYVDAYNTSIIEFVNDTWSPFLSTNYTMMLPTYAINSTLDDVTDLVNKSDDIWAYESCLDSCTTPYIYINFTTPSNFSKVNIEWWFMHFGTTGGAYLQCWTGATWTQVASISAGSEQNTSASISSCSISNGKYAFRAYASSDFEATFDIDYIFLNRTESSTLNSSWSNVTKVVNSTVGITYKWKVFANDTGNLWNTSLTYSYLTTSACSFSITLSNALASFITWGSLDSSNVTNASAMNNSDTSPFAEQGNTKYNVTASVSGCSPDTMDIYMKIPNNLGCSSGACGSNFIGVSNVTFDNKTTDGAGYPTCTGPCLNNSKQFPNTPNTWQLIGYNLTSGTNLYLRFWLCPINTTGACNAGNLYSGVYNTTFILNGVLSGTTP